jgi:maltose alpha-D-glucosyltransferase/alpha-amylase
MKFIRRFEEGVNPGVEVGRFLSERANFPHAPRCGGSVEYRGDGARTAPATVAVLEEFISNEDDGWSYVVDALTHGLEEAMAHRQDAELRLAPPRNLFALDRNELEPGHLLVGAHLEWASLLGRRTAELHRALTSDRRDPDFAPEPLTAQDRQALYHGARSMTRKVFHDVRSMPVGSRTVEQVLQRENEIIDRMRRLTLMPISAERIRCHGDYHLGQVLWTGKDFVIIDFEGEPSRSLSRRRLKRPAVVDLAGMVRSLHYAGRTAALRLTRDLGTSMVSVDRASIDTWLTFWHRWVSGTFLDSYLQVSEHAAYLPDDLGELIELFDFFLLEKAVYELGYEANSRPDWVDIPARGILDILDSGS